MQTTGSHQATTQSWRRDDFHKSSFSPSEGQCVEVAARPQITAVRDSKTAFSSRGIVEFPTDTWAKFRGRLVNGEI